MHVSRNITYDDVCKPIEQKCLFLLFEVKVRPGVISDDMPQRGCKRRRDSFEGSSGTPLATNQPPTNDVNIDNGDNTPRVNGSSDDPRDVITDLPPDDTSVVMDLFLRFITDDTLEVSRTRDFLVLHFCSLARQSEHGQALCSLFSSGVFLPSGCLSPALLPAVQSSMVWVWAMARLRVVDDVTNLQEKLMQEKLTGVRNEENSGVRQVVSAREAGGEQAHYTLVKIAVSYITYWLESAAAIPVKVYTGANLHIVDKVDSGNTEYTEVINLDAASVTLLSCLQIIANEKSLSALRMLFNKGVIPLLTHLRSVARSRIAHAPTPAVCLVFEASLRSLVAIMASLAQVVETFPEIARRKFSISLRTVLVYFAQVPKCNEASDDLRVFWDGVASIDLVDAVARDAVIGVACLMSSASLFGPLDTESSMSDTSSKEPSMSGLFDSGSLWVQLGFNLLQVSEVDGTVFAFKLLGHILPTTGVSPWNPTVMRQIVNFLFLQLANRVSTVVSREGGILDELESPMFSTLEKKTDSSQNSVDGGKNAVVVSECCRLLRTLYGSLLWWKYVCDWLHYAGEVRICIY